MNEIFVDNFAGGGGASTGIELAIGRNIDIAINHDPDAIAMHKANHPNTKHYCEDVWEVNPVEACNGRSVALAWFSPDCKHFSRAKGGKPVDKKIRGLAWVAIRWALLVRPRVIMLENVPEIQTWGPLIPKTDPKTGRVLKIVGYGHKKGSRHGAPRVVVAEPGEIVPTDQLIMIPDITRKGETFEGFIFALTTGIPKSHPAFTEMCNELEISVDSDEANTLSKGLGYKVQCRTEKSCDYGAPTTRTRFYMIARCDGKEIVWPEHSHAPKDSEAVKSGEKLPYRTAAECIDWSIPAKSIFERDKPLAENTLRRIARGIKKFVIDNPEPFIINYKFDNEPQSVNNPLTTVTSVNNHYVVTPTIMSNNTGNVGASADAPLPTVTTGNRNFLVTPTIVPIGYGERDNQQPRVNSVEEPLGTIVSSGKHYVAAPILTKFQQHSNGQELDRPIDTVMPGAQRFGLVTPTLIQYHSETTENEVRGQEVTEPIMTIDTKPRYALACAHIMKNYAGGYTGAGTKADAPLDTVTAVDHNSLVTANLITLRKNMDGQKVDEPISTISCSGAHHAEVQAFLVKYFSTGKAKPVDELLDTVTTKDRFALVTVHGEEYIIADIRMRMLQPKELFKAQGFPDDYIIDRDFEGNEYSKSKQVARCGNAVTPPVATALVRANLPEYCKVG